MNIIRLIKLLCVSIAASALLTVIAFASAEPEFNVPDTGISALMFCGAIVAIGFARRRFTK